MSETVTRDAAARRTPYALKRPLDVVVASAALVVTTPLWLGAALGTYFTLGSPVLFRQERGGYQGRAFLLRKFRTMRPPAQSSDVQSSDSDVPGLSDGARLTRFGRWLRSTSVDELPSLLNILSGEMSLVGPRPLLIEYLPRYSPEQARRHAVKPGLTGWAQVQGRNQLSWDEKFALDVWYVEHQSLSLDLKILLLTATRVLQRSGINAAGHATMPEFLGSHAPGPESRG